MDITMMLNHTIQTLSRSSAATAYQPGEIEIIKPDEESGERGGREASPEDIEKMIKMLDKAGGAIDSRISFIYNDKTRHLIMRVTDPHTKEIVRQIPSKEMIHILENIHDMVGMFVDDKR